MPLVRAYMRSHMLWLAAVDLVCLLIGSAIGVSVRFGHEDLAEYVFGHTDGWLLLFGGVILANYLAGSYRLQDRFSRFNLFVTWIFSLLFTVLVLGITSYAWFQTILGRGVLLLSLASYSAMALVFKLLIYRRLFQREAFACRAAIVGTGERARETRRTLEAEWVIPSHRVVAFIEVMESPSAGAAGAEPGMIDGVRVTRCVEASLPASIRGLGVSLVVIDLDEPKDSARLYPKLRRIHFQGIEVLTPLGAAEVYRGHTPLDLLDEESLLRPTMDAGLPVAGQTKRLFDVVIAFIGCLALLPLGALVAVLIKVTEPFSPVIYTQIRAGQFGRPFRIYKFRTMRKDGEQGTGPVWAREGDSRVTPLGRFLRKYRLDELPQLLNILKGNMSLVGPRPERPELIVELERQIPFYSDRENVLPGLTGWAQIRYPYGASVEDATRKLEYDLYYIRHLSFSLDLQILLSTLRIVVFGKERTM